MKRGTCWRQAGGCRLLASRALAAGAASVAMACAADGVEPSVGAVHADTEGDNPSALRSGETCEALLDELQDDLLTQVAERAEAARIPIGVPVASAAAAIGRAASALSAVPTSMPASTSGDLFAFESDRLYLLHGPTLYVLGTTDPAALELEAEVPLGGEGRQVFVRDQRVTVLSQFTGPLGSQTVPPGELYHPTYVKLSVLDASQSPPELLREAYVEGYAYVPARRDGAVVRQIVQHELKVRLAYPSIRYEDIFGRPLSQAAIDEQVDLWVEHSRESIDASTLGDYLPLTFERAAGELVELPFRCADFWLSAAGLEQAGFTSVIALDTGAPQSPLGGVTLLALASQADVEGDALILRQTEARYDPVQPVARTHLHRFELDGVRAAYTASGSVAGFISGENALDTAGSIIRAAATEDVYEPPPPEAGEDVAGSLRTRGRVVTLEQRGSRLVELGRSEELAFDAFINATQIVGDHAIVATYSPTQLFVVDLTNPRSPELVGHLQISDQTTTSLLPLPGGRLLGVGEAPDPSGYPPYFALQLFDLTDPSAPRLAHHYVYDDQWGASALPDARSVDIDLASGRLAFAFRGYATGVSSVELFEVSETQGFTPLGRAVPERSQPPLAECLELLSYPSDAQSLAELAGDPELVAALLEQCSQFSNPPLVRRGLLRGEALLALTNQGVAAYAVGAPSGPPLSQLALPEIYVAP